MIRYALTLILPVRLMPKGVYQVYLMNLSDNQLAEIEGHEANQERLYRRYAEGHNDVIQRGDTYYVV